jgi:hypothetical protein
MQSDCGGCTIPDFKVPCDPLEIARTLVKNLSALAEKCEGVMKGDRPLDESTSILLCCETISSLVSRANLSNRLNEPEDISGQARAWKLRTLPAANLCQWLSLTSVSTHTDINPYRLHLCVGLPCGICLPNLPSQWVSPILFPDSVFRFVLLNLPSKLRSLVSLAKAWQSVSRRDAEPQQASAGGCHVGRCKHFCSSHCFLPLRPQMPS